MKLLFIYDGKIILDDKVIGIQTERLRRMHGGKIYDFG